MDNQAPIIEHALIILKDRYAIDRSAYVRTAVKALVILSMDLAEDETQTPLLYQVIANNVADAYAEAVGQRHLGKEKPPE